MTFAVDWSLKTNYLSIVLPYTLLSFCWNSGRLTQYNSRKSSATQFYKYMLGLSVFVRNPPNSDMDYKSFNVRTWPFLCMRIHTGVGHTKNESAQHFWLGKTLTNCSCAPDGFRTSGLSISTPTLYDSSHPSPSENWVRSDGRSQAATKLYMYNVFLWLLVLYLLIL